MTEAGDGPTVEPTRPPVALTLALAVVTVLGGVVTALVGLAHVPTTVIGAVTAVILVAVEGITLAVTDERFNPYGYWGALACLTGLLLAVPAYHRWHHRPARTYTYVLAGSDVDLLYPSGSPGGPADLFLAKLGGGSTVDLECFVPLRYKDGIHKWFLVAGSHPEQWLAELNIVGPAVDSTPLPPRCSG